MLCFAKGFTINLTANSSMQAIYTLVPTYAEKFETGKYYILINVYLTT